MLSQQCGRLPPRRFTELCGVVRDRQHVKPSLLEYTINSWLYLDVVSETLHYSLKQNQEALSSSPIPVHVWYVLYLLQTTNLVKTPCIIGSQTTPSPCIYIVFVEHIAEQLPKPSYKIWIQWLGELSEFQFLVYIHDFACGIIEKTE